MATPSPDDETSPPGSETSPPDDETSPSQRGTAAPDSNWWYVVLAVPVYFVLASVAGFVLGIVVFVAALTGATGAGMGFELVGVGFVGAFAVILLLVLLGFLLSLAFPAAIYFDAEAVAAAGGDWQPDPALYGLLGLVGVVAQPLQVPLAAYYLYKRHESVGVP